MLIKTLKDLEADLWVFDCDGVIYANVEEAQKKVVNSMIQFLASRYKCSFKEALNIRNKLLEKHQVPHSIMAFVREGFDEQEVLQETYFAIDLKELGIIPSPEIGKLISSLSGIKVILTNNHGKFARAVIDEREVTDCFSAIYGINELGLIQKPDVQAFQYVQEATGIDKNILFLDDEIKNVTAANEFGWTAVLINEDRKGYQGLWLPKIC